MQASNLSDDNLPPDHVPRSPVEGRGLTQGQKPGWRAAKPHPFASLGDRPYHSSKDLHERMGKLLVIALREGRGVDVSMATVSGEKGPIQVTSLTRRFSLRNAIASLKRMRRFGLRAVSIAHPVLLYREGEVRPTSPNGYTVITVADGEAIRTSAWLYKFNATKPEQRTARVSASAIEIDPVWFTLFPTPA